MLEECGAVLDRAAACGGLDAAVLRATYLPRVPGMVLHARPLGDTCQAANRSGARQGQRCGKRSRLQVNSLTRHQVA